MKNHHLFILRSKVLHRFPHDVVPIRKVDRLLVPLGQRAVITRGLSWRSGLPTNSEVWDSRSTRPVRIKMARRRRTSLRHSLASWVEDEIVSTDLTNQADLL